MIKETFGVAIDEETVREVDELFAGHDNLGAVRAESVESILSAFIHSESDSLKQVREIIFGNERERSGYL